MFEWKGNCCMGFLSFCVVNLTGYTETGHFRSMNFLDHNITVHLETLMPFLARFI